MKYKLIIIGLIAGFSSAALGIGGGVILVPALILIMKFDIKTAAATSLTAIAPSALTGIITHYLINSRNIKIVTASLIIAGSITGARLGVYISSKIKNRLCTIFFALLLIIISLKLTGIISQSVHESTTEISPAFLVVLGVIAGSSSALFGIGGGVIMVPALTILFGLTIHEAIGTSLAVIFPTTIAGAYFHNKINDINLNAMKFIIPASLIGAVTGALVASHLDAEILKFTFGILLLIVSVRLFINK